MGATPASGDAVSTSQREVRTMATSKQAVSTQQGRLFGLEEDPPIVAAVEPATARVTAETAVRFARQLHAPITFLYVRRTGSASDPLSERSRTRELFRASQARDVALSIATEGGVTAQAEVAAGDAADEIVDFARSRAAQLLIVGARERRSRRSVSRQVVQRSNVPVVVARTTRPS
jgi:nucleotide-binding universal stress UspA family protein